MRRLAILWTFISCLLLGLAGQALAQPDPNNSTVTAAVPGRVSVLVCPACDGDLLERARSCTMGFVDATITVTVRDAQNNPIAGFPATDLLLTANGLCFCPPGKIADGPTDANGETTFTGTLCAGGCSHDNSLTVLINGMPIPPPGLPIWFNSPDMNCDLVVNLSDVALFAACFMAPGYRYCCDLSYDCVINLSDVVVFSSHFGHYCP